MSRIEAGDAAPDFTLEGSGDRSYALGEYRGEWLILAFYPGDFTPVCTRQFCSYRDAGDRLDALGAAVLGVSPQSVGSHERFAERYGLTIPLLADPDKLVCADYGVLWAGQVRRSVFIIDPAGIVRYRHSATLGLTYRSVDQLAAALGRAREAPPS
jgi:peroxiredoxin Q/BCP